MIAIWNDTESLTLNESIEDSDYGDIEPRISRTATLDGKSVFTMGGCTHADRTITVVAKGILPDAETRLRRIVTQALIAHLSNKEGVFLGVISHFSCKSGNVNFTFLVKEKVTED